MFDRKSPTGEESLIGIQICPKSPKRPSAARTLLLESINHYPKCCKQCNQSRRKNAQLLLPRVGAGRGSTWARLAREGTWSLQNLADRRVSNALVQSFIQYRHDLTNVSNLPRTELRQ